MIVNLLELLRYLNMYWPLFKKAIYNDFSLLSEWIEMKFTIQVNKKLLYRESDLLDA